MLRKVLKNIVILSYDALSLVAFPRPPEGGGLTARALTSKSINYQ